MTTVVSPDPMPFRTVRVTLPAGTFSNLKRMQEITAQVLARFGCPSCHSGLHIRFQDEEELVARVDPQGGVRVTGVLER